ncbi:MAG TPA: shikimate dehydrogenase [Solirubrobacteraceae bacterium]|jgi:shikimate dehydrogenase
MRRLGVLGWPVAHSRSPAMHNAALAALGMEQWRYQRLPVSPELFVETTRALGAAGFVGANVTIPHKEAALALADRASEAARAIGAANTLTFHADGEIAAENTDAPGLIAAIEEGPEGGSERGTEPGGQDAAGPGAVGHPVRGRTALVLGAGGSARAAVWALLDAGASEVSVWNRTPARAQALARELGARAVARAQAADILVNCTSVGLQPSAIDARDALTQLGLVHDQVGEYSYVVDLVYLDAPTPLLAAAERAGVATLDGLRILVAQGALSFELWTGRTAPREVMLAAARAG